MAASAICSRPLSATTTLPEGLCSGLPKTSGHFKLLNLSTRISVLRHGGKNAFHLKGVRAASAMASSFGSPVGYIPAYPRRHIRDPYKRLGVSRDSTDEEIREARNFLVEQYALHEKSVEAIEDAYDTILMRNFKERKNEKFNFRTRLQKRVEESPPWVKRLLDCVEKPERVVIYRKAFLFSVFAIWSITNAAQAGPYLQVFVALVTSVYLLYDKIKSIGRAGIIGFSSLVIGWIIGSLLAPTIPPFLISSTWSHDLLTALIAFIFMFIGCTFCK